MRLSMTTAITLRRVVGPMVPESTSSVATCLAHGTTVVVETAAPSASPKHRTRHRNREASVGGTAGIVCIVGNPKKEVAQIMVQSHRLLW